MYNFFIQEPKLKEIIEKIYNYLIYKYSTNKYIHIC